MSEALPKETPAAGVAVNVETPLHYMRRENAGAQNANCGVLLREAALLGHLTLRGNPDNELFLKGVEEVLGVKLPTEPCSSEAAGQTCVYWLGPTEWLVIVEGGTEADVEARLRQTLHGHFAVVDVSGGQTLINLSGEGVEGVLKKSSGYDFHPGHFGPGRCVQTTFAKATALVSKKTDGSFDLVVRRSFADYLFSWIADAAAEYGFAVEQETVQMP